MSFRQYIGAAGIGSYFLTRAKLPYHVIERIIARLTHFSIVGGVAEEYTTQVLHIVANRSILNMTNLRYNASTTVGEAHTAICKYFNLDEDAYQLTYVAMNSRNVYTFEDPTERLVRFSMVKLEITSCTRC